MQRVFCKINTPVCLSSYLYIDGLHNIRPISWHAIFFRFFFLCAFTILFRSRSQLSLLFFLLVLIWLPSSLVYNGFVSDSSILYPDFIREYYSSLTLNRIMPRFIRMFIRGITYLSVRSLNPLVMKTTVRNIIDSNMKRVLIGCYLEYFCSKLMTRFWQEYLIDTCRRHLVTLLVFFLKNENDEKQYELWFETIANVHVPLLRVSI